LDFSPYGLVKAGCPVVAADVDVDSLAVGTCTEISSLSSWDKLWLTVESISK
jgi:hypothetical protein